jgi:hypothetical protein
MRDLRKFELLATGGEQLAIETARNFRSLRPQGHTVRKTIDCLIATFCFGTDTHFYTETATLIISRKS